MAKPVRSFEKRVSGKLSGPSGKYLSKKKTALSGLPKHAPYGIEKVQRLKSSVHPSLRPSWQQRIDSNITANLAAMGINLVGGFQVILPGQRRHLQAEAARAQRLVGVVLAPEHIQLIEPLGADIVVCLEADVTLGFEEFDHVVALGHALLHVLPAARADREPVVVGLQAMQPLQRPEQNAPDLAELRKEANKYMYF